MSQFDMYRAKKKKEVDPNAPPRPNLLSHEKTLKETKATLETLQLENRTLKMRVDQLESKLANQTAYLNHIHQLLSGRR